MNKFLVVPPQRIINESINILNSAIRKANAPLNKIRNVYIGFNKKIGIPPIKVAGKKIKLPSIKLDIGYHPFKNFWDQDPIKKIKSLKVKCIDPPRGYFNVFGFDTPNECKKKDEKKKDDWRDRITGGSSLKWYFLFLVCCLLGLFWAGYSDTTLSYASDTTEVVGQVLPTESVVTPTTGITGIMSSIFKNDINNVLSVPAVPALPAHPAVPALPAHPAVSRF